MNDNSNNSVIIALIAAVAVVTCFAIGAAVVVINNNNNRRASQPIVVKVPRQAPSAGSSTAAQGQTQGQPVRRQTQPAGSQNQVQPVVSRSQNQAQPVVAQSQRKAQPVKVVVDQPKPQVQHATAGGQVYVIATNMMVRTGPGMSYDAKYSPYCDIYNNNTHGAVAFEGTYVQSMGKVQNGYMYVRQLPDNNDRDNWEYGWVSTKYLVEQ